MNQISHYLEELFAITEEANGPNANMAILEELRAKLSVADTLGVASDKLEHPLLVLKELQEKIDKVQSLCKTTSELSCIVSSFNVLD